MKKAGILIFSFLILSMQVFAVGSGSGGTLPDAEPAPAIVAPTPEPITDAEAAQSTATPAPGMVLAAPPNPDEEAVVCNDVEDLRARITCRLDKDREELEEEYGTDYLPEECRPMLGDDQNACIERYKSLWPCWEESVGPKRISCVKEKLDLPEVIVTPADYCKTSTDAECVTNYRKNVYHLITFRFYDAEERVEEWHEEGLLSLEDTVEFIAFIAESKVAFNESETKAERREIIEKVMTEWDSIVTKVKSPKSE